MAVEKMGRKRGRDERMALAAQVEEAFGLLRAGVSIVRIAETMAAEYGAEGWSPMNTHRRMVARLREVQAGNSDAAEAARRLDIARCDDIIAAHYPKMLAGADKPTKAVLEAIRLRQRLHGNLDAGAGDAQDGGNAVAVAQMVVDIALRIQQRALAGAAPGAVDAEFTDVSESE